jgi:EAL domain-containing protein (putative c-di-GMP-specific phosphodiesterase class I)
MTRTTEQYVDDLSGLKVLVLEDHTFQRNLLIGVLENLGVQAISGVADGPSGLLALDHFEGGFDVAICDLRMEGMDGIEFIRHAAQKKVGSFIVTSAIDAALLKSAETILRRYGTKLMGVLPKPVDIDRLKHVLADCKRYKNVGAQAIKSTPGPTPSKKEIRHALQNNEFIPYFQPKFDLVTGLPNGVEMLARWNHPTLGVLPPSAFIPVMEQTGLIDCLSESLFTQSLECVNEWSRIGYGIGLAINLSPLTLQNTDMPNHIGTLVRRYAVAPSRITIEVTETAVSENISGVLESMTRLRMQGFSIAVDDFGTGYSSLLQLSEMPFTEIKIDRNFVTGATENKKATVIAESIVDLAKKLNLHTVAEGVETRAELDFIKKLGCETGQGYFLAKPMNHVGLMKFLALARRPK